MASANEGDVHYRVLTSRSIWIAAVFIIASGVGLAVWLLVVYGHGDSAQRNQLEAIKTAGTIVVGTGGAAALLLAARRQRTAEIALKQKDRDQADVARAYQLQVQIAHDTRNDAIERRITELYTKAVEQLGSDQAPVRLGGLYALERLAQGNESQRQTIVNVFCAYLRMPVDLPGDRADNAEYRNRVEEREVRLAAQAILDDHLRGTGAFPVNRWDKIDLDLTGATLIDFSLRSCRVRNARFAAAVFHGDTSFAGTSFDGVAEFGAAEFKGNIRFNNAEFGADVSFGAAVFAANADFESVKFYRTAAFQGARFDAHTVFTSVRFGGGADFNEADFSSVIPVEVAQVLSSLPLVVPYGFLSAGLDSGRPFGSGAEIKRIPIGVTDEKMQTCYFNSSEKLHFVALMGLGGGKTNLLRVIVRGIMEQYSSNEALIVLVDFNRTMLGYIDTDHLLSYVVNPKQLQSVLEEVKTSLKKRIPGVDVTQEQLKNRSWWRGPEVFVVVDDYDEVTKAGNPLAVLVDLLSQASDIGLHFVVAASTHGAGDAIKDEFLGPLLKVKPEGLVGSGNRFAGPLLGEVLPSPKPPGRAVLVRSGESDTLVQVAWSPQD